MSAFNDDSDWSSPSASPSASAAGNIAPSTSTSR
eukprot:CAMPEP_0181131718 /NCGR_PEP_ID=MMETSP1071-20121207/30603_1 /TAXON_ID=35127 /ORGANISM="Thalassiosira sp., Strain NH16" /LENGTH=33 /DNA_ID= /DNA_START= /DNA_END= /DNA_ORIENTATION=